MECLEQAWTLPSQPKKCQTHTSQGYRGQILWGSQGNFPGAQPALQLIFRQRGPHSTPECTAKTQNLCKLRPELLGLGLCQTLNSRSLGSHRCVHRDICHGVGEQTFVRRIQVDICQRQNVVRKKKKVVRVHQVRSHRRIKWTEIPPHPGERGKTGYGENAFSLKGSTMMVWPSNKYQPHLR